MEIIVSARHFELSPRMKEHVENKLNEVFSDKSIKVSSARVILDIQKSRCKAEIVVNAKHLDFEAVEETYEMYESIDAAIAKLEKQLRKYLDKAQEHHKGLKLVDVEGAEEEEVEIEAPLEGENEVVK